MSNEDKKKDNKDDATEERSPQVGALLKASRLRVGEDLREVSDILCIRYLYLEAIEECRYDALPGDTYAVGFIRSYAEHLGLAGEEVVRRFRAEQAGKRNASDLSFPTPVQDSGVPKGALVFVGALLALLVYGGWYMTTSEDSILSDLISPVPDHLKHLATDGDAKSTTSAASEQAAPATTETTEPTTPKPETAETAPVAEVAEKVEEVADAAAATATSAAESTVHAAEQVTEQAIAATEQAASSAAETVSETASEVATAVETAATDAATETAAVANNVTETVAETVAETSAPASSTPEAASAEAATPASDTPSDASIPETTSVAETVQAATSSTEQTVTTAQLNESALQQATATGEVTASSEEASAATTEQAAVTESGIVITATSRSWVEIRNTENGDIFYTGLLAPGKSINVPEDGNLVLDTGNAGALNISVDGELAPSLGGEGDVRKNVALDADRLKAGTATNR